MDSLLHQLLSFPPHPEPAKPLPDSEYDKHIKNLVQHINTIPASKLTSEVPGGGDLLDVRIILSGVKSLPGALTDIIQLYRSLIPRKTRSPTSTHYSLISVALLASKRAGQYPICFHQDQHYGRRW